MSHPANPPVPTTPVTAAGRVLDRSLVEGIAWTAGLRWLSQILSWASTVVIARLLTPADYGLVGMALVYLGLVQLVNELGLSAAIVQRRDLTHRQIAELGGVSVSLGIGLFALSAALAGVIAGFFGEPAVRAVILVLSLTFVTSALQVLPRALMQRDLQFRKLAVLDGLETILLTVSTLALVLLGWRYWGLVVGGVIGKSATTAVALAWRPHALAWPKSLGRIRDELSFGGHIVVSRIAWYVYNNADMTIVGRVLGSTALGAYTLAWTIASIPVNRITGMVTRVTPGVFSAVQTDLAAMRRYILGLTEGIALTTFPAAIGLALVADDFVRLVLGEHWSAAVIPLRLLSLFAAVRSLTTLLPQVLVAMGQAKRNMQVTVVAALVLPFAFYLGSRWGTTGVALAWVIGYPLVMLPLFYRSAFRAVELSAWSYLRALWPAVSSSLVMSAAVLALRSALAATTSPALRLSAAAATGALVYGATVFLAHRPRLEAARRLWVDSRR